MSKDFMSYIHKKDIMSGFEHLPVFVSSFGSQTFSGVSFLLHSSAIIFLFLIKKSKLKGIKIEMAF